MKKLTFRTGKNGKPIYPQSGHHICQGFIREEIIDLDQLSPLARFLAENLSLIWPGNAVNTQTVSLYSSKSDAWHKRQQSWSEKTERMIAAYDLENTYTPINYMYFFDYLVGQETPEQFLNRHAQLILDMPTADRVVIGNNIFKIGE